MWNWLKDNGTALVALAGIFTLILTSNNTLHNRLDDIRADINQRFDAQEKLFSQRFDAQEKLFSQRFDAQDKRIDDLEAEMNRRFDAQDKHIDRLTDEVSEIRKLTVGISERVSRNEGEIDVIRQQIQTADNPAP